MRAFLNQTGYTFWALANRRYLRPTHTIETFASLNVDSHIKVVILDKDNCFAYPRTGEVWHEYAEKFKSLKENCQFELKILSNTAGDKTGDPTGHLANKLEETVGVPVIRHELKKPMCYLQIKESFAERGIDASNILVVGDRLATDVLLANLMGSPSVWVSRGVRPGLMNKIEKMGRDYGLW